MKITKLEERWLAWKTEKKGKKLEVRWLGRKMIIKNGKIKESFSMLVVR
jgi:hypothetical protein